MSGDKSYGDNSLPQNEPSLTQYFAAHSTCLYRPACLKVHVIICYIFDLAQLNIISFVCSELIQKMADSVEEDLLH